MPNTRQTLLIASPSSSRATNRRRSAITEHSFHGVHASPGKGEGVIHPVRSVTYVSGRSQELTSLVLGCFSLVAANWHPWEQKHSEAAFHDKSAIPPPCMTVGAP